MQAFWIYTNKNRAERKDVMLGARPQPDEPYLLDLWIGANAPGESCPYAVRRILRPVPEREGAQG